MKITLACFSSLSPSSGLFPAVVDEVLRSFTYVKVPLQECKNVYYKIIRKSRDIFQLNLIKVKKKQVAKVKVVLQKTRVYQQFTVELGLSKTVCIFIYHCLVQICGWQSRVRTLGSQHNWTAYRHSIYFIISILCHNSLYFILCFTKKPVTCLTTCLTGIATFLWCPSEI